MAAAKVAVLQRWYTVVVVCVQPTVAVILEMTASSGCSVWTELLARLHHRQTNRVRFRLRGVGVPWLWNYICSDHGAGVPVLSWLVISVRAAAARTARGWTVRMCGGCACV